MLFNSVQFLLFLPLVFVLYWIISSRQSNFQNTLLLVSSYVFYGWWDWRFLLLIAISTIVDYYCGLKISEGSINNRFNRKAFLYLSCIVNLGILGFFKYYNFFIDSWIQLFSNFGYNFENSWSLKVILPVGISFYTFQTLSYTIDVYRNNIKAEKNLLNFATFVAFFPQLVAGPIERARNLLPQIQSSREFSYPKAVSGLRLILWGFFKKIVIADSLAPLVDVIFADSQMLSGGVLVLGLIYFAFQIYCDFSGYSDIAIGTAKLFGIDLMVNFRFPYFASSIRNFWRRWHISLSTWFRDYIYIPLGGSHGSKFKIMRNLFVVFLLSGLWHGANLTFLAWGFVHAILFIPAFIVNRREESSGIQGKISNVLTGGFTFAFVTLAWAFFRSPDIDFALSYLHQIFTEFAIPTSHRSGMEEVLIIVICDFLLRKDSGYLHILDHLIKPVRWISYLIIGLWIMSVFNTYEAPFIYFQF